MKALRGRFIPGQPLKPSVVMVRGNAMMIAAILLLVLISGCASIEVKVYRLGDLEVRVYSAQRAMTGDLPPTIGAVAGIGRSQVLGFFDRQNNRVYSIDDIEVLLHELKHHAEPQWTHDLSCTRLPCEQIP